MKGESIWKKIDYKKLLYNALENNEIEVDLAIIGGGITGITAAIELIKSGKKVALIEAQEIGGKTTSMSTENLYIPVQPYYHTISKINRLYFEKILHNQENSLLITSKIMSKNLMLIAILIEDHGTGILPKMKIKYL